MRNLIIDESSIYVLNFKGKVEVRDSEGFLTGETTNSYSKPIMFRANVSGARGSSQAEMFGNDIKYDKTIVLSSQRFSRLKMNEFSVLFIGKKPTYDQNNFPLYNYKVEKIAETKNVVSIAVSKVRAD
jgi:hypothetical protein